MSTFRNPFFAAKSAARNSSSRTRNTRYAPESLEGRLSPSSFSLSPVYAEVSSETPMSRGVEGQDPLPTDPNGDPIPVPASGDGPGHDLGG